MNEPELDPKKVTLLQDLTTRHGKDIPAEQLELNGITKDEYATWRMDLADDEEDLRDLLVLRRLSVTISRCPHPA